MPVCKICDEVVSVLEIKDGICKNCREGTKKRVETPQKQNIDEKQASPALIIVFFVFMVCIGIFVWIEGKPDRDFVNKWNLEHNTTFSSEEELLEYYESQSSDNESQSSDKRLHKLVDWQFDTWSGEHKELTKYIKRGLKHPDTFNQEQIRVFPSGKDHFIINIIYSAKNSYGMVVKKYISAKITIDGTKITIKEEYGL